MNGWSVAVQDNQCFCLLCNLLLLIGALVSIRGRVGEAQFFADQSRMLVPVLTMAAYCYRGVPSPAHAGISGL